MLLKSEFNIATDFHDPESEIEDREHGYSTEAHEAILDGDKLSGTFDFELYVSAEERELLSIKATYGVFYELDSISSDDHESVMAAKEFCQRVGMFTCWPYFRQYASYVSDASLAHLPPLPVLKQKAQIPPSGE